MSDRIFNSQGVVVQDFTPNGYDYRNQAWVVDGKYQPCSHPAHMHCDCFGTRHAGEPVKANADVH